MNVLIFLHGLLQALGTVRSVTGDACTLNCCHTLDASRMHIALSRKRKA
jgi:hypothetical protein